VSLCDFTAAGLNSDMTRHAKNVTAGNVYTTHERKKDAKQSGYGSESIRLGKDSIKVTLRNIIISFIILN